MEEYCACLCLKQKSVRNTKSIKDHKDGLFLANYWIREIRHNVPSYCIRKRFRKYRPGLDIEAPVIMTRKTVPICGIGNLFSRNWDK